MIRWIPYTFVRIVLFFIGGITLGIYQPDLIAENAAGFLLLLIAVLYVVLFFFFRYSGKPLFNLGVLGLPAIFLAGYVHSLYANEIRDAEHFSIAHSAIKNYRAVITKYAEEKPRSWKTEASINAVLSEVWENKRGRVVFYFSKEEFPLPPRYGDVILIKGSPRMVDPPANPEEFDYKRFLGFRNIYHQHFLRRNDVITLGNQPPSMVVNYAYRARVWADKTLKKFVNGEREQAIASALVLGVTDGLDNELLNAYAATGAMHVLAVSGLHITIIYLIIVWLLKPVNRLKSGPWILAIVSLFMLWAYAFVTGLSPSVLRAVTMFSFIALARPTGLSTNIYNTLAASAFCLLMFDPFLIMSVGFQLSYLAVVGIVYIHPGLYRLWEPKSRLYDEVWKITCVSLAAQIATFGLGLLYFHQFPNYFLLCNLLVIPGSFLVLVAGLIVLSFGFIEILGHAIGFLLTWLIKFLNIVVFTVESFPFSLIEDIHITIFQCWILIGITIAFILLMERKRFSYVVATFCLVLAFTVDQWQHYYIEIAVKRITVYKVPGHTAIDFIDRGQAYFVSDSTLYTDREKIKLHISPNRLMAGIQKIKIADELSFIQEFTGASLMYWHGLIIARIHRKDFVLPEQLQPDLIIVGNNAVYSAAGLAVYTKASIVLDSSNSFYFAEKFLRNAQSLDIDVYSVWHQGAFNLRIANSNS